MTPGARPSRPISRSSSSRPGSLPQGRRRPAPRPFPGRNRQQRFEASAMTHVHMPGTNRPAFVLAGLALLLTGPSSFAQQFVLFDTTFTFTKEDADTSKPSKSHYYVRGKMLNPD